MILKIWEYMLSIRNNLIFRHRGKATLFFFPQQILQHIQSLQNPRISVE